MVFELKSIFCINQEVLRARQILHGPPLGCYYVHYLFEQRTSPMTELCICSLLEGSGAPAPACGPPTVDSPGCGHWRETTLRRLEAWIEEREQIIARIETRLAAEGLSAGGRPASTPPVSLWPSGRPARPSETGAATQ